MLMIFEALGLSFLGSWFFFLGFFLANPRLGTAVCCKSFFHLKLTPLLKRKKRWSLVCFEQNLVWDLPFKTSFFSEN